MSLEELVHPESSPLRDWLQGPRGNQTMGVKFPEQNGQISARQPAAHTGTNPRLNGAHSSHLCCSRVNCRVPPPSIIWWLITLPVIIYLDSNTASLQITCREVTLKFLTDLRLNSFLEARASGTQCN